MFAPSGNGVGELLANMHSTSPVRKRHRDMDTESARTHALCATLHCTDTVLHEHIHTYIQRGTRAVPHSRT